MPGHIARAGVRAALNWEVDPSRSKILLEHRPGGGRVGQGSFWKSRVLPSVDCKTLIPILQGPTSSRLTKHLYHLGTSVPTNESTGNRPHCDHHTQLASFSPSSFFSSSSALPSSLCYVLSISLCRLQETVTVILLSYKKKYPALSLLFFSPGWP